MAINVNWAPPAGAVGAPLAKAAASSQFADLMLPYAQQYAQMSFGADQTKKQQEFQAAEAQKNRDLEWKMFYEKLPTKYAWKYDGFSGGGGMGSFGRVNSFQYKTLEDYNNQRGSTPAIVGSY